MTGTRIIPFPNLASLAPTTDVSVTAEVSSSSPDPVGASAVTTNSAVAKLDRGTSPLAGVSSLTAAPPSGVAGFSDLEEIISDLERIWLGIPGAGAARDISRNVTTFRVAADSAIHFASSSSTISTT